MVLAGLVLLAASVKPAEAQARAEAAISTLQQWYVERTGLYTGTGWWNAANAITAVTNEMLRTGSKAYLPVLAHTFAAGQVPVPKDEQTGTLHEMTGFPGFLNNYYDDEGWWALAWVGAYDLTHDAQYLAMSESIFRDMAGGWDETCGGGIWWSKDRKYKNAIANELFFSLAAHLATRETDPARKAEYTSWTGREWAWFAHTGMINSEHLINDGLFIDARTGACTNNGKTTWTYNQGVILGALAEDAKLSGDGGLLKQARSIADAALGHLVDGQGILHESCEGHCGGDGVQFKGIFVRNLAALQEAKHTRRYAKFLKRNAESVWTHDRGETNGMGNVLGVNWAGPPGVEVNAGSQSSALDALVSVLGLR